MSSKGEYIERFERALERHFHRSAAVCSSGTGALHLALLASGVGRGDTVVIPNLTFAATASAVLATGASVLLRDIDPDTWTLPADFRPQKDTKAVIPVHLYGMRADMAGIMRAAGEIVIIEDACEAFDIPPVGDFGCYSFFANKHITTGEGGAVVGRNLSLVKLYRDGGQIGPYIHSVPGLNYRMTNMQAALGCAQMERLEWFLHGRSQCAGWYADRVEGKGSWYFAARIRVPPQEAETILRREGIETRAIFKPLHLQDPFVTDGAFPISVDVWKGHILVPTGPHVTERQVERICRILKDRCGSSLASTQGSRFPTTSSNKVLSFAQASRSR